MELFLREENTLFEECGGAYSEVCNGINILDSSCKYETFHHVLEKNKNDFKILMSHDPSHWEYEVKEHPNHYHLTLSGHTHGLQFGIEIPGVIKWSPVQYIYKQWAGLYENMGRYIYVNRGFGFHAYPGRVGIMPEITVIELKKSKKLT